MRSPLPGILATRTGDDGPAVERNHPPQWARRGNRRAFAHLQTTSPDLCLVSHFSRGAGIFVTPDIVISRVQQPVSIDVAPHAEDVRDGIPPRRAGNEDRSGRTRKSPLAGDLPCGSITLGIPRTCAATLAPEMGQSWIRKVSVTESAGLDYYRQHPRRRLAPRPRTPLSRRYWTGQCRPASENDRNHRHRSEFPSCWSRLGRSPGFVGPT